MANTHRHESRRYDYAILFMRLAMGGFIFLHGISKLISGINHFVNGTYAHMTPTWVPQVLATPYGYFVPIGETLFGALLILGLYTRTASTILFLMLLTFSLALLGAGSFISSGIVYHQNVIFLTILAFFIVSSPGRHSLDRMMYKRKLKGS